MNWTLIIQFSLYLQIYTQHKIWSNLCSQEGINREAHFSRVLLYEPITAAPFPDPKSSIYYTQRKLSYLAPFTPPWTCYFIIWQEHGNWPRRTEMMWKSTSSLFHVWNSPEPQARERWVHRRGGGRKGEHEGWEDSAHQERTRHCSDDGQLKRRCQEGIM